MLPNFPVLASIGGKETPRTAPYELRVPSPHTSRKATRRVGGKREAEEPGCTSAVVPVLPPALNRYSRESTSRRLPGLPGLLGDPPHALSRRQTPRRLPLRFLDWVAGLRGAPPQNRTLRDRFLNFNLPTCFSGFSPPGLPGWHPPNALFEVSEHVFVLFLL